MLGTLANDCCTQELEEVAIQLLPPEIVAEIGLVDTTAYASTCRSLAVIERLATHLISILGLAGERAQHQPPPPTNAEPYNQHTCTCAVQKEVAGRMDGSGSRVLMANGGMAHCYVPGLGTDMISSAPGAVIKSMPAPIAPYAGWMVVPHNGSGTGVFLPAKCHDRCGTGVFLPRAEAYKFLVGRSLCQSEQTCSSSILSYVVSGAKPPRLMRKQQQPNASVSKLPSALHLALH